MSSPSSLDYAPDQTPRRQRVVRNCIFLGIALTISLFLLRWGPALWLRVELLYWQRQCMTYVATADQTVYDSNLKNSFVPSAWSHYYFALSPPGLRSDGTVFLHGLTGPDGRRRLVAIDLTAGNRISQAEIFVRVFVPGTIFDPPRELNLTNQDFRLNLETSLSCRIFAGTVDPNDPSHFTFKLLQDDQATLFDGWLEKNDEVIVGPRRGSTIQQ